MQSPLAERAIMAKHVPIQYFHDQWIPAVRAERPTLFLLAEVMNGSGPYSSVASLRSFLDAGFDSAFNFWLRDAMVTTVGQGNNLDALASVVSETWKQLGEDRSLNVCNILDNHDMARFANVPGLGVGEDEIQRRSHLALALLFTLPGIPQLYYGDEIGMYGQPGPSGDLQRRPMPEWAWTAEGRRKPRSNRDSQEPHLCLPYPDTTFRFCHDLIALRDANSALYDGYYAELWRPNGGQNVYAFLRAAPDNRIIVVVNESNEPIGPLAIPIRGNAAIHSPDKDAFRDGSLLECLLGQNSPPSTISVSEGGFSVSLPPRSFGVFRHRP
jgi:alpha-amylase